MQRTLGLIVLLLFFSGSVSFAMDNIVISPGEAGKFVGKRVQVCGKVSVVQYLRPWMGSPTYIKLQGPGPAFVAVIMGIDRGKFGDSLETLYEEKEVCITGIIIKVKNWYQINVLEPFQIELRDR